MCQQWFIAAVGPRLEFNICILHVKGSNPAKIIGGVRCSGSSYAGPALSLFEVHGAMASRLELTV